jgi:hypothetical protein
MNDPDFDDIAQLWQQPDEAEEQVVQLLAERTGRRARMMRYADLGFALLLGAGILVATLLNGAPLTYALGALLVFSLLWYERKTHRLLEIDRLLDPGDRESLVAAALKGTRARLHRTRISLFVILPGFLLGWALAQGLSHPEGLSDFPSLLQRLAARLDRLAVTGALLALLAGYLLRSVALLRREEYRLERLRSQYREETTLDEVR